MTIELKKRMDWASASIDPTKEVLDPVVKTLYDLPPPGSTEGAREVAQLCAWRAAQDFAFQPVMEALEKLRNRVWDPNQPFMFADSVNFSWKTAPIRKYASFEDFYRRELQDTWGKWEDLEARWRKVVTGEHTEKEAAELFLADCRAAAAKAREQREQAVKNKLGGINLHDNVMKVRDGQGNSASYRLRRLAGEAPEILEAYERGEFKSVAAAARAAGIIRDRTALELLRAGWRKAGAEERAQFLAEVGVRVRAGDAA